MKGFVLFVQQTEQTMRVRVCLHKSTKKILQRLQESLNTMQTEVSGDG